MPIIYETLTYKDIAKAYLSEINKDFEDQIHLLNVKIVDFEKKVKLLENENTELKEKIPTVDHDILMKEKEALVTENFELKRKISENLKEREVFDIQRKQFEAETKKIESEKSEFDFKIIELSMKISDLEEISQNHERKSRNIKLSKQVSDFEKIVVIERSRFRAEREELENKTLKLTEQVNDLQRTLEEERKQSKEKEKDLESSEKVNIESPEYKKVIEKDFETERKIFESEIKKLTSKLAGLSTGILKEQRAKSDLQMKVNLIDAKRNRLTAKVKELESLIRSSKYSHADSYSKKYSMRPSNLFYNYSGCSSGNDHYEKGNNLFVPKSPVQKNHNFSDKSSVKPSTVFSQNDLFRLSQKKTYGSYFGTNVSVWQDRVDNRFISYYEFTALNKQGLKFRWVPKSV